MVLEKKRFKAFMFFLPIYSTGARADTPQRAKFWSWLKRLTILIIHCKFQPLVLNTYWKKKRERFFNSRPHPQPIQIYLDADLTLSWKGQRSTLDHNLNKLGRAWVLDAIYQNSAPKLYSFWRRRFHFVQLRGTIEQTGNTLSTDDPSDIWWITLKQFQRRRHLKKIHNFIRVYIPEAKADNPQRTKFYHN